MPARIDAELSETFLPAIIISPASIPETVRPLAYGCEMPLVVCFAANAAARATRRALTEPKAAIPDGGTIGAAFRLVRASPTSPYRQAKGQALQGP
jgi:hypothetical protein